jgi:hypothetical protein
VNKRFESIPSHFRILAGTAALAAFAGCAGAGTVSNLPGTSPSGSSLQSARHQTTLPLSYSVLPPDVQRQVAARGISAPQRSVLPARDCNVNHLGFVSDYANNVVYYIDNIGVCGQAIGGFTNPQGIAVDRQGNLWVANTLASNVLEFAPPYNAGPKATLNDPGEWPVDVCVDLQGNVAVTNIYDVNGGPGNVVLYAAGNVNPTGQASNANYPSPRFCAYASNGNLAFDDWNPNNGTTNLGLVLRGNSNNMNAVVNNLTITNQIGFPGGVQVPDHGGLAVLDQNGLVIDSYKNPKDFNLGAPIAVSALAGAGDPVQFQFYRGSRGLLAVDAALVQTEAYHYPAGGNPFYVAPLPAGLPIGAGVVATQQFGPARRPEASSLP